MIRRDIMSKKPKVMILGTFHLRYTPDFHRGDFGESIITDQQREIEAVVKCLKEFKPTKIALEVVKEEHTSLNDEYDKYLNGELRNEVNEIHQFGFRTAAELGHKEVYAVDWMESVGNRGLGQVYDWAKEEQPDKYEFIKDHYWSKLNKSFDHIDIYELVKACNTDSRIKLEHELNMMIAQIGKGTDYIGIDWLRWWYQRNLIIYANLVEMTVSPEDRTLLIIGSAHIHLLTQFIKESGTMDVIPAINYFN
ncbi:hypothetical protein F7984_11165 [Pradoshia sp. D12]|nr:hypothetical protein F7984_11165 [Pradoshia sp. D12]TPF73836.1 hypothetical protein FHY44_07565 [Bacillus sp. D12]